MAPRALPRFVIAPPIAVNSPWRRKQLNTPRKVSRVIVISMVYIAMDKTCSGTVPQWLFLEDFQPATERKKKPC